jgi:Uma2 family endonuclease
MTDTTQDATGMATPHPEPLPTLQDYIDAATHYPAEVVNGVIVAMHPPDRTHARIGNRMFLPLANWVEAHDLGEVFTETAFVLDASETPDWVRNSRIPDVAFITQPRIEEHDRKYGEHSPWRLAPDIAVEVVSPNDRYQDVDDKIAEYLFYGVKLIVIINPRKQTVRLITSENQEGAQLTDKDTLSLAPIIEGWSMPVADLFKKRSR